MDDSAERTKVEWREWGDAAFEEAREEDKPVLLSLSARWCSWCHEMDETTYALPTLAANVNDSFIPVRADIDRQPRVRERYNMGGFPTTVFLTPEGEHLTGATFLDANTMRQVVGQVRDLWKHKGREASQVPRTVRDQNPPAGEVTDEIERLLVGQVEDRFDPTNGGWGDDAKFPLPRTVEFALKRDRKRALATLSPITANLYDDYEGGFFRYAGTREWNDVHREKMLDVNAALLRAYANAYLYTGEERYRDPAAKTVEYLTTTLWEGDAFGGSQRPGDGYYEGDVSDRESREAPAVDFTAFADRNALAADALLTYTAYTDDEHARRYAERTLDFLASYVEDGAVVHYRDGDEEGERGLLADQATVIRAFVTAAQVLGDEEGYLDIARSVADHAIDTLQTDDGAFIDGPEEGPGLLDRSLRPVDDNAAIADALVDLAMLTGEEAYEDAARDAIGAFAGAADRIGVQVAGYATAASRLCRPPLRVVVATEPGSNLHRAALRLADHEKVVVLAPDGEYERGTARLVDGETVSDAATSPAELSELAASFF
ncbi:hypothetical protein ZOD2009_03075 [Haladaptatus paucihalophilus DX253]|uniref:Spermatogenesis-associated protein 20-like TRX domain-containing protein n=1 Tax=Haladaptatus paucihalophilus DX253 TaxID=797209 RepID=E7QPD1_HALPU|nr:DUF255 domain-containing protein [Haladaptatus paucihalophilus]EFW94092.1 hypothetical protein ZOD2009_03075 [Haladaptatus paucihalophilus DX253]SHK62038.1 hypothetical protein SAMN05444342_1876 [Haladaptatus paucihalophilus DX253]